MPASPAASCTSKSFFGQAIDRLETEFHFTASGVHDGLVVAGDNRLPERPHVVHDHRVDHRQTLRRADLDQAKFGPIGMLGDEFRVQRNPRTRGELLAKLAQLGVRRDALVIHAVLPCNNNLGRPVIREVYTILVGLHSLKRLKRS